MQRPQNLDNQLLDIRLLKESDGRLIAVDNALFRDNIRHTIGRILRYLRDGRFHEAIRFPELDPGAKDDLRSVMIRSFYAPSWTGAYLDDPGATVGFAPVAQMVLKSGDKTVVANFTRKNYKAQDDLPAESKANQEITGEAKTEERQAKITQELHRKAPSRYVIRSFEYRSTNKVSATALAAYSKLLVPAFEEEEKKGKAEQEEVASIWHSKLSGSTWPPKKGSSFSDLDEGTKRLIHMSLAGSIGGSKFGSGAELDLFLNGCTIQSVDSDIAVSMQSRTRNGVYHLISFPFGSILR